MTTIPTRRIAIVTAVALAAFLALLTFSLRGSFWTSQDYGMLSISHAIHLEWRLSHGESFPAPGLAGHPGIPFYLASWLAVFLVVPSFSGAGYERFSEIMANIETIYLANQAIAIALIAVSTYAFIRVTARVASAGVILVALGLWLGSSYQAILTSTALSIETFALPLNILFLWILLRLATHPRISVTDAVACGLVAALGYLLKLPYLYIAMGLGAAFIAHVVVNRTGMVHSAKNAAIMIASFLLCIGSIGYSVIGETALMELFRFHESVLFHTGYYGNGAPGVIDISHAKAALQSFLAYGSMAPWVALMLGFACIVFAVRGWQSGKAGPLEVILGVGVGAAAIFAAIGVLKHFNEHYVAGVAPTLPGLVIALTLLVGKVQPDSFKRLRILLALLLVFGISYSIYFSVAQKQGEVAHRRDLLNDRLELEKLLQVGNDRTLFTYHVSMQEFGEGFILHYSGIPALVLEYRTRNKARVSSYMQPTGSFKYVVVDKAYFPNITAVRNASNLDPIGTVKVSPSNADRVIELRRSLVVIKPPPTVVSER